MIRITDGFTYSLTRSAVRRASFVLTVSEELRQRAIGLGVSPERARTIMSGCDSSVFRMADRAQARLELGLPPDAQLILFVGRLEPLKGIQELFDALARLVPSYPRLELACIGENFLEGRLQARAAEDGLNGHVRFLGPRTASEIARWLAASNLLCLPSYSEGCPSVVLEALCCGRPVVASRVGNIPELVDARCGILVPPADGERLAEALSEALLRPWDEAEIAARFHRGWDDVAEETYEVCCSVVEQRRA